MFRSRSSVKVSVSIRERNSRITLNRHQGVLFQIKFQVGNLFGKGIIEKAFNGVRGLRGRASLCCHTLVDNQIWTAAVFVDQLKLMIVVSIIKGIQIVIGVRKRKYSLKRGGQKTKHENRINSVLAARCRAVAITATCSDIGRSQFSNQFDNKFATIVRNLRRPPSRGGCSPD